jgi:hypothetical protein
MLSEMNFAPAADAITPKPRTNEGCVLAHATEAHERMHRWGNACDHVIREFLGALYSEIVDAKTRVNKAKLMGTGRRIR